MLAGACSGRRCARCSKRNRRATILFALLVPSPKHKEALKTNEAWVNEARALLGATLGLKLITRAKTWPPIADELWRFLLLSEFVFDLPSEPRRAH